MSSFFTLSSRQKKRKRDGNERAPISKRKLNATAERASVAQKQNLRNSLRDDSISGSDSDTNSAVRDVDGTDNDSGEEELDNETSAEQRLRLAERYLENIQKEIDGTGFDAAALDRDLIAERLQEDVSESNGKLYRHIASSYDLPNAVATQIRSKADCTTSISVCAPYIYTASKDCTLTKWEIPLLDLQREKRRPQRRRPLMRKSTKGSHHEAGKASYQHHTAPILCVAASSDGRFVVTGGADKRLIVWSSENLAPLRVFTQHRDKILSLAFRRDTNQLYTASADRTIKTWSLNELAYVETLFGHQDAITDVTALSQERCLSAGSRDRTVRLWKVVEETQLVFRGGSGSKSRQQGRQEMSTPGATEGSIERVAFIDQETFVSGSDDGSLSLWTIGKKKAVFTISAAHGFEQPPWPDEGFAALDLGGNQLPIPPDARWITALAVIPYSDLVLSGSWDGYVRAWQVSSDKRKLMALGIIGEISGDAIATLNSNNIGELSCSKTARGFINDIDVFEYGPRGKEVMYIVAALGKEHRLGRWKKVRGKNGAVLIEVPKRDLRNGQMQLP